MDSNEIQRWYFTIKEFLRKSGYELVDMDIYNIIDYLEMCSPDYTMYDWLKDTLMNYPENLREV